MADDKLAIPSLPSPGDGYDRQNEAAFRREVQFLMYEIDASLSRFADTIQSGLITHADTHDAGGTDPLDSYYYTIAAADLAFSALGHTHTASEVTDFATAADARIAAAALEDIGDVAAYSTLAANEILQWSGSAWVHQTLAEAGVSATGHTHVEANITDLQAYLLNITGESLGDLSNVTDASSAAGWFLRTTGAGTWVAQLGLTEADITDLGSYLTQTAADALYSVLAHTHTDLVAVAGDDMTGALTITTTGETALDISNNTTPARFVSSVANSCWLQMNDVTGLARMGWTGSGDFGLLVQTSNIDINFSTAGTGVVKANGTAVSLAGHTHVEAEITDLGTYLTQAAADILYEPVLGNPASDGYILSSTAAGARSWIANTASVTSLADVGDVDAYATPASGEVLMWDGDSWLHRTLAEAGIAAASHTHVEADITDLGTYFEAADNPTWTGVHIFQGATTTFDGAQDIVITPGAVPKISSTGILQLDAASGNYHYFSVNGSTVGTWGADYLTVGPSSTTDLKIHEPTAGEWTIEALSTNDLVLTSGGGVRVDKPLTVEGSYIYQDEYADTARVRLRRASGTKASPTAVTSGNWIGEYQFFAYDDAGFDLAASIRAIASETHTATNHGTDLAFYATPDAHATAELVAIYNATGETFEFNAINGVVIDSSAALLEITSAADVKVKLNDDVATGGSTIDWYNSATRRAFVGNDDTNLDFYIRNLLSSADMHLITNVGQITVSDDGGTTKNRIASISAIVDTGTPSGTPTYGAMYMVY